MSQLDVNGDGVVDYWEFCVHFQKRREGGLSSTEAQADVDEAFGLFAPDADGTIDASELRRLLQCDDLGSPLNDNTFAEMVRELGLEDGGRVRLDELRNHPAFC